ncbi:hypothetical protein GBA52_001076 [Prunus armeniaca]|nr:hypothetical protein GBA52_001076 [Prunus armeniaca]
MKSSPFAHVKHFPLFHVAGRISGHVTSSSTSQLSESVVNLSAFVSRVCSKPKLQAPLQCASFLL